jgi:glutamate-5-semialdehyde dehydrogenase
MSSLQETIHQMGKQARAAAYQLAQLSSDEKNAILRAMAAAIREATPELLAANAKDIAAGTEKGLSSAMLDRLTLDAAASRPWRAASTTSPPCPIPSAACWRPSNGPNGLEIERVATPLGVIGVIYESRPNVTADAGGLCLKAGNAAILRGGSESFHSARAIHACLAEGLRRRPAGGRDPARALSRDRAAVGE